MSLLAAKLIVTPLVILVASLVSRRWGDTIGGWVVGLPVVSGPVSVYLMLEHGASFAAEAAVGSITGVTSQACFCLGYGLTAGLGWPVALAAGTIAYVVTAWASVRLEPSLAAASFLAALLLLAVRAMLPRTQGAHVAVRPPWWEIPARMGVVTVLVLLVTALASAMGPRGSGVSASYPVVAIALTVFAHRARGPLAGIAALRGMASALFGFIGFFIAVALMIAPHGAWAAYVAATSVALMVQAGALAALRRDARPPRGDAVTAAKAKG